MKLNMLTFRLVSLITLGSFVQGNAVNPVGKAIELLTDLQTKITAEGEASEKNHAEASTICKDQATDLDHSIQMQNREIADSTAVIQQETANIQSLGQKIEDLGGDTAQNEADLNAATSIRATEKEDFQAEEKEVVEMIDTLERAISILQKEMQKSGGFLQGVNTRSTIDALDALVKGALLSSADASRLTTLIQSEKEGHTADDSMFGAPDAAAYEGRSHDIIETLEDLLDKAQAQLDQARKDETNAAHNFDMFDQSLKDENKYMTQDLAAAKKALSTSTKEKGTAEGDLAVASKSLAADESALETLNLNCEQAEKDFKAEMASREEELSAIAAALTSLSEMTENAAAHSYALNQESFLQRGQLSSETDLAGFEVVRVIRDLERKEHTPELAQLAARVASLMQQGGGSGEDPFVKVKGLIADLITKLEHEASAEASQKAYCDEELAESNAKKEDKSADVEKLTANIDEMTAKSAKLKDDVAILQRDLADLASTKVAMDTLRKEEHDTFVQTKADMEMGLQGVALASKSLREYFARDDKQHEAAQDAASSIIGMLEVIQSDFSKDLAGIEAGEAMAQSQYESTSQQNAIEKAVKDQDVKYKTKESASLDKAVAEASSDRANVQAELDAVNEYLGHLEQQCTDKAMTYEERKKRREDEIAGLKDALKVLESETSLIQSRALRHKRSLNLRPLSMSI